MIIHPIYLPFNEDTVKQHFLRSAKKCVDYFKDSTERYKQFLAKHPVPVGLSVKTMGMPCQVQKDEKFWTTACLMAYYHSEDRIGNFRDLLRAEFGEEPPIADFRSWSDCLKGDLGLYFEVSLPAPKGYKDWLKQAYEKSLKVGSAGPYLFPYQVWAAQRGNGAVRKALEGPTHVDALLLNKSNGFAVFFEAKVLSDISCDTTYDPRRNQLARIIDVMLELKSQSTLGLPRLKIRPNRSLFVLLTPEMFKQNPESRLYGFLMRQYQNEPATLGRDIPHREDVNWQDVSHRLGWLTWEDCDRILTDSCPWLVSTSTRCAICGARMDEFFAHYPNPVCRRCDSLAVNEHGGPALHVSMYPESIKAQKEAIKKSKAKEGGLVLLDFGDDGDNPVFIGGIKCWRRYRFGGWVTMRDFYDCKDIGEFYRKNSRK